MSRSQQHTVVQISLRSMLAITFGVAVVMAVVGPYINALETDKKWQLLYTLISMGIGMAIAAFLTIRQRHMAGQRCGPLLLFLTREMKNRNKKWLRWFWLLILMPFIVLYFSGVASSYKAVQPFYVEMMRFSVLPAMYSQFTTQMGLKLWAEGYANGIELCENGILNSNKFYAWSSPAMRDMYWGQAGDKIVININRFNFVVPVPREQREAVDAILENYYRPSRVSKT